jgi:cytoskeletal protein CcmA (bactofilin family)
MTQLQEIDMRTRARRFITAGLLSLALLFSITASAAAADYRAGGRVTVESGETVADDLYVGAGTTVIDGRVEGDLTVASGTVDVRGVVTGSVNSTGGQVRVSGTVDGAVRLMGGDLSVSGSIGRDVVVVGGVLEISSGATVGGDVAGATGTLRITGNVEGDVLAASGEVTIDGTVGGGVDANLGRLRIGSGAVVGGDVLYASEREAEIADGAQIGGDIQRRDPQWAGYRAALPDNPATALVGAFLGLLVLGWGLMLARPAWVVHPGGALHARPLLAFGAGLATWVGQFLLLVALAIFGAMAGMLATAFGGAFAIAFLIVLLAIVVLIFVSQVYVAMAIGGALAQRGATASPWLAYALGALIWAAALTLIGWLVGALGGLAFVIGWMLGLGALALDTLDRRRADTAPSSASIGAEM